MVLEQGIALFSATVSFTGLLLVVKQLRNNAKTQASQSLVEIYDINRQLLSLCFSHPQLFDVLGDAKNVDPDWERRYLQLWLNQFSLIHSYMKRSVFGTELNESLESELADFMKMQNMQNHWRQHGSFYPLSFQELVNSLIEENEFSNSSG